MEESLDRTAVLVAGSQDSLIATLNKLIAVCKDGEEEYHTGAQDVTLPAYRGVFLRYAKQRARFAVELGEEVQMLGGDPADHGSLLGALRAGWIDVKSAINGNDERSAVLSCCAAEEAWQRVYEDALREALPVRLELLIRRQLMGMRDARAHLRSIADALH